MSIIEYFTKTADLQDSLYPLFSEVVALRTRIAEIRQQILLECIDISSVGRGNDAKVVIADRSLFDQFNAELTQKEARLSKILETFTKLDEAIKPALDAGLLMMVAPTPTGIAQSRSRISSHVAFINHANPGAQAKIEVLTAVEKQCSAILAEL